jgi:Fe2+ or Zn2+ uptake regulation protein
MKNTKTEPTIRSTKYCRAIVDYMAVASHATNSELHNHLRGLFPAVSATTIHRATTRLAARGEIQLAPRALDGSLTYDANTKSHDHFQCQVCGMLRDANLREKVVPLVERSIGDCKISGSIVIGGVCRACKLSEKRGVL